MRYVKRNEVREVTGASTNAVYVWSPAGRGFARVRARMVADLQETAETGRSRICKAQWLAGTVLKYAGFLEKGRGRAGVRGACINSGAVDAGQSRRRDEPTRGKTNQPDCFRDRRLAGG